MKNIYYLLLLIAASPFYAFGQDASVYKAAHVKRSYAILYNELGNKRQRMDSCVYNKEGQLIFIRNYNLFGSYDDRSFRYNTAGLRTMIIVYEKGQPSLMDSSAYDAQGRLISSKMYTSSRVMMDKQFVHKGDRVEFSDGDVMTTTRDKDGLVISEVTNDYKTLYTYWPGKSLKDKKVYRQGQLRDYISISEDGTSHVELTYQETLVAKVQISRSKGKEEKIIFGNVGGWVPVKKEVTTFTPDGLKSSVKYYEREKFYQELKYTYVK